MCLINFGILFHSIECIHLGLISPIGKFYAMFESEFFTFQLHNYATTPTYNVLIYGILLAERERESERGVGPIFLYSPVFVMIQV